MSDTKTDQGMLRAAMNFVQRMQYALFAGRSFENKRDLYKVLGYDRILTPMLYRARYERNAIANRVVECLPRATWRGGAEIIEDNNLKRSTEFEWAVDEFSERMKLWSTFLRADILAGLGQFSAVWIGFPGDIGTPAPRGKHTDIIYLTPYAEEHCQIVDWVTDPKDERFGLPLFYTFSRNAFAGGSTQQASGGDLGRRVHWSRVLHIADSSMDDIVFGTPRLQKCWNLFDDLEKVTGGGAEAFWLRANQGLNINLDKDMTLTDAQIADMEKSAENYGDGMRRLLRTRGADVQVLGSDVADLGSPTDAIITQIAGGVGIPKRILVGSEKGELASTQDRMNFRDQVQDRREAFAGPMVVRVLIDRLIDNGYLPEPESYEIKWPTIKFLNESERAAIASQWASINSAYKGEVVIMPNEIREHLLDLPALKKREEAIVQPAPLVAPNDKIPNGMKPATPGQLAAEQTKNNPLAHVGSKPADVKKEAADANPFAKGKPRAAASRASMLRQVGAYRAAELAEMSIKQLGDAAGAGDMQAMGELLRIAEGFRGAEMRDAEFNPDQPRDESGKWADGGGSSDGVSNSLLAFDGKNGDGTARTKYERPTPIKVSNIEDAVKLILAGKTVELPDVRAVNTAIKRLADMANDAKSKGENAPNYDLCNVSVAGSNLFCGSKLRSAEYPNGVPRIEMPQMSGKPEPGSIASMLPTNKDGEVDGTIAFVEHLKGLGIKTSNEDVIAAKLRASQSELVGTKVAGMMTANGYDPGKVPVFISRDNYVVDGHHRWAAVVGRDAADGKLGELKMHTIRIDAPISEVLHLANTWAKQFGIAAKTAKKGGPQ